MPQARDQWVLTLVSALPHLKPSYSDKTRVERIADCASEIA